MNELAHEKVVVTRGRRSGLPIIIAVHSTALGTAAGGCRMWTYPDWRDGLEDALRLSQAMTYKCTLAGLPNGGGKTVIPLPPGFRPDPAQRRDIMLDLGDAIESLGGIYGVAEDVGTTAEDMAVANERTRWAYCLPESQGGTGEPSEPTAHGVLSSLKATCEHVYEDRSLAGRVFTIIGLGQVGGRLARLLAAEGAVLQVTDIDESKRALADELGATWLDLATASSDPCDVLVPAALGGVLTAELVPDLQCRAIVGPTNNQLASDDVADLLAAAGILWAPDFVVNAGGVIYGVLTEIQGLGKSEVAKRVDEIGDTLTEVLVAAKRSGQTPFAAAAAVARAKLAAASA